MSTRIEWNDTMQDIVIKMCDRNPGAVTAIMELLENNKAIDPDNFLGNIASISILDSLNIYGADIYVLWSDICNKDIVKMITVLRASQLGFLSSVVLKDACSKRDYSGKEMIDIEDLYMKVCDELENFDKD